MLNPKRRTIYIIVIAVCVLGSIAVLIFSRSANRGTGLNLSNLVQTQPLQNPVNNPLNQQEINFNPPAVFPSDSKFDRSVFSSSIFTSLKPYQLLIVNSADLGRDDPFKPY